MRGSPRVGLMVAVVSLLARAALGYEAWAFRFNSTSPPLVSWHDDLIFHNTSSQDGVVHLIALSNGGIQAGDTIDVAILPGRTVSLKDLFGAWEPQAAPLLWVAHFEVPDGVLVVSRGGADGECPSPCTPPTNPFPNLGTFSMPVFRSLVPAGQAQVHMGADLGLTTSRFNAGIFNAGSAAAAANIAVYQACDDTPLETRTVSVPPDTAIQIGGLGSVPTHCPAETPVNIWLRYAIVTVDQPSLSYIVNIADPFPAGFFIPLGVPIGP